MRKEKYKGRVIEFYDSIEELSIVRFQKYNLNVLIDAAIGSDLNSVDQRCVAIRRLMSEDTVLANREVMNLQQCLRFIISEVSPEMNSFVVLIHKIGDRRIEESELTDEGIKAIIQELSSKGVTMKFVRKILSAFKKKSDLEFETYFPKMTDSVKIKEFYTQMKKRTKLILQSVITQTEGIEDQINEITEFMLASMKPKNFFGSSGVEVKMKKGFEETCLLLRQNHVCDDPKSMTVLAYYQALELIRQQMKQRSKK